MNPVEVPGTMPFAYHGFALVAIQVGPLRGASDLKRVRSESGALKPLKRFENSISLTRPRDESRG